MTDHIIELLAGVVLVLALAFVFGAPPVHACEMMVASWYGAESGNKTANGDPFDGSSYTAAHKTLPFGTVLFVQNVQNGQSVRVRINDRGPFHPGRQIDLAKAAADRIGLTKAGVGRVRVCRVG